MNQANQAHNHSDVAFSTAFKIVPVNICITRLSDGRIIDVNERFVSVMGYTREESLGWTPVELGIWLKPELRAEGLRHLHNGYSVRDVEADLCMKNGEIRTFLLSADLIEIDGQVCVLTTFTDITERKRAEVVLRQYQLLSERTRDIILFLRADGQIVEANAAAVEAYGYDRPMLLTRNIRDLREPATNPLIDPQMATADTTGIMFTTIHRRRDGSTFPAEVSSIGADIGDEWLLMSIIRDITDRQKAEIALRESQERLASIVTSTMDAIITINVQQHILMFNGAAEQMFGYTADQVIGQSIDLIIPTRFRTFHPQHITQFGHTGVTNRSMGGLGVISGLRANSIEFPIEASISQIETSGQKLYTVILRDITARKQAEAERAELLAREHAARIAAEVAVRVRDTFLSTAAHELKTPLTILFGNIQLLQRHLKAAGTLAERDERALRVIGEQAMRLNQLIAAMLDISRLQADQLSITLAPLDMCMLIRRVIHEIQPTLVQHTLIMHLPDSPLMIEGDELRLEQVLQNLLSNAVKYSPVGGSITIQAEQQASSICVTIADQGIGIPQESLPQLFQRFYRAHNVDPRQISGVGIGLYVVKAIVEQHGGYVHVISTEGQGSSFIVCLPQAPNPRGGNTLPAL